MQSDSAQAMMERLAPFVGEWSMEAAFPSAPPNGTRGRTTFEWILGGRFLLQRSQIPHPDAPDGLMVIGVDPGGPGYLQHYFDSRGVTRVYRMTFGDGRWELLRDSGLLAAELPPALHRSLQRRRRHDRGSLGGS